ncbi:MAG: META domain-containing protein [Leptolyngbyaceae cyanobacterium SL_7_1]|nr:META domain-containing protein [Leptolyngbyaceae cyanobacterium SL_7_1]
MKKIVSLMLGASIGMAGFGLLMAPNPAVAQSNPTPPEVGEPMTNLIDQLANTEWLLEDLTGTPTTTDAQTTLRFDGTSGVSGRGGCNRYRAQITSQGDRLSVGPAISTRMMCAPVMMDQETRYFQALQAVQRFSLEGDELLIYGEGEEASMRFSRLGGEQPSTGQPSSTQAEAQTLVFVEGRRNVARVFVRNGQTLMNVYDKQTRTTWVRGVAVDTRQNPEGTYYTNRFGEADIVIIVPTAEELPRLVINGEVDR